MKEIDINSGLSSAEAAAAKKNSGGVKTKSVGKIISSNIFTFFNLINVIIAVALAMVGSRRNMLFMGVVAGNAAIGIFEEIRAKIKLDKLKILTSPKANVIRDGKEIEIDLTDVAENDIMVLRSGNSVCADCVVLDGTVEVNESLLTGESEPTAKRTGDELYSGSFITSGYCKAQAVRVGDDSFSGKITASAKGPIKRPSAMMNDINKILKIISLCIFPFGAILFTKAYFFSETPLSESVEQTAAALIGMIPEGLLLLTSTALAVSSIRLARKKTLCRNLYCAERLSRVDILCIDKTGTLTEGKPKLENIILIDENFDAEAALFSFVNAFEAPNSTLRAIAGSLSGESAEKPLEVIEFSSERKWSAAVFEKFGTLILGAEEFVLKSDKLCKKYSQSGLRVLVLAYTRERIIGGKLPNDISAKAVITLSDTIRPSASSALEFFRKQGVQLKIISGDSPETVADIARKCGFEGNCADMSEIKADKIAEIAEDCAIFGRATPDQKVNIIKALKASGHTVAMIGDGVNDVPALIEADCSAALQSGSDAARCVCELVLMNSDFSSLADCVNEGRRCINNIERSSALFLVKTIFSFILSALLLFLPYNYPFKPIQLTLISALMIGAPSFLLTLEPNFGIIRGSFAKNALKRAAPFGIAAAVGVIAAEIICRIYEISDDFSSTICVLFTAAICFWSLIRVCIPFHKKHMIMCITILTAFISAALFFPDIFFLSFRI
ncbi:MAG: HAD-IC family P-type ATPase [Oscillospiraceae bacterium]|nr:HAD-IC family P-type ATPase [Oscillospiraceae bacterium]